MTGTELMPASAWVQAVFVCLFIVLVIGLLAWFSKQSDKWQGFMLEIDEKWRAFNKEQRYDNNCQMKDVNDSISDLAVVTQALVSEVKEMRSDSSTFYANFQAHDAQAKDILYIVQKPTRSSRAKQE